MQCKVNQHMHIGREESFIMCGFMCLLWLAEHLFTCVHFRKTLHMFALAKHHPTQLTLWRTLKCPVQMDFLETFISIILEDSCSLIKTTQSSHLSSWGGVGWDSMRRRIAMRSGPCWLNSNFQTSPGYRERLKIKTLSSGMTFFLNALQMCLFYPPIEPLCHCHNTMQ